MANYANSTKHTLWKNLSIEFDEKLTSIKELKGFKNEGASMTSSEMFQQAIVGMGIVILEKYIGGVIAYHFWKSVIKGKKSKIYFMHIASKAYKKKPEWSTESFSLINIWKGCESFIKSNYDGAKSIKDLRIFVSKQIKTINKDRSIIAHQDYLSTSSTKIKTLLNVEEFKLEFDDKYLSLLSLINNYK